MEEAIIDNSSVQKASLLSDNSIEGSSCFAVKLLKERTLFLENELKKDTIINCLTKKLIEVIVKWLVKVLMLTFLYI